MSDNVASLGFEVNSKQLDDAKTKLKELSTEAGNTGQAVDKFNQSASKTGDALGKITQPAGDLANKLRDGAAAATAYAGPIGAIEAAANRSGVSVGEMAARIASTSAGNNALINSLAGLSGALGSTTGKVTEHGGAVRALASEHHSGALTMTEYREVVHSLGPTLEGLGVQLSTLTQFSYAARGGMAVLAAAAGGALLVAMGKSRDEIEKMNFRLEAFAGESNGAKIGADLKKASDAAGVMPSQIAPAVESVLQLENALLHADPHVIYAPGYNPFDGIAGGAASAVRAVQTVTEQFKLNKLDSTDATKATNEFFASVQKAGGLTAQEFDKLNKEAPTFAQALAKAFNGNNVYDFQKALEKSQLTFQQLQQTILKMGPTTDAQFKQAEASSKSFGDAVDELQKSFKNMWVELSGGEQPVDTASNLIKKLSDALKALPDWLKSNSLSDSINEWLDSTSMSDAFDRFSKTIVDDLNKDIFDPISNWFKSTSIADAVTAWAQANITDPITRAVQVAASAIKSVASGGIGASGGALNPDAPYLGGPTATSGGAADNSGSSVPDYSGVSDYLGDLPAFASGGSLLVGGDGGTDTTLVQFKATAGETIDVKTPIEAARNRSQSDGGLTTIQGQPAVVSATPDPASMATIKEITDAIDQSTIDISKKVLEGSDQIVNAVNRLTGGVASTTINPATGLPISRAAASTAGGFGSTSTAFGGSGGVGGFKIQGSINPGEDERAKAYAKDAQELQQLANQQGRQGSGLPFGMVAGQGRSIGGGARQLQSYYQRNAGMPVADRNTMYPFGGYGGMPISSPVSDYSGTGDLNGTLSDFGGGTSEFYGTDAGGSGTFNGSISDIGATDILTGAFDPGMMDYGGGSVDYGYFKEGGRFTVGGPEGTDKSLVKIHATKGEKVIVVPNSVKMPSTASSRLASNPSPQSDTSTTMTKNVIINVQAGIQANDFIKSRAQIARGI